MISCLFHNRAIRRHLDESEPLSQSTKAHIEHCATCRELLALHSSIVRGLAAIPDRIDPPPFLHARVMNSLRKTPTAPRRDFKFQWAAATCAVALITISIALLPLKQPTLPTESAPSWPTLETQMIFKTSLPENPLESEIKNLREDTLNAAKGLAATFLPTSEDPN
jgi:hypothetical protein